MPADRPSYARIEERDGATIIWIVDPKLLTDAKEEFYALADRVGRAPEPRAVVLNLARVHVFQSMMLGVLINFQKRVREAGGTLKLCELDPQVRKTFALTRLDTMVDICDTESDALKAAQGKGGASWFSKMFGSK